MYFKTIVIFQKCISLLSFLCSLSFSCISCFSHLKNPLFYRKRAQTRFLEKQLIQLSSGTNKLIRLNLKSVCNSSVLCFPKLLIQLCSLWFDLNHLTHVLMNFFLDVHRFSFTANHTHSH